MVYKISLSGFFYFLLKSNALIFLQQHVVYFTKFLLISESWLHNPLGANCCANFGFFSTSQLFTKQRS
jgi:hypothetical protein